MGIEPTSSAWKAEVLPLNYTRSEHFSLLIKRRSIRTGVTLLATVKLAGDHLVEGGGFEPPKAEPTDLQSAPFDRSGTPPGIHKRLIFSKLPQFVNRLRPFSGPFYTNAQAYPSSCPAVSILIWMGRRILYDRTCAVQPATD